MTKSEEKDTTNAYNAVLCFDYYTSQCDCQQSY